MFIFEFLSSFFGSSLLICLISILAFIYAARLVNQQSIKLNQVPHSLLNYYGFYSFLWVFFPSIIILVLWSLLSKTFIDNQFLFLVQIISQTS